MTLRERHQQATVLNDELRSARERLAAAMRGMDYEAALTHQIEVDDLERELQRLDKPSLLGAVSRDTLPAKSNFIPQRR
jgi:hypothetical protein